LAEFCFLTLLGRCDTKFRELTDRQWKFIEPLLPPKAREGRPRSDDRRTINGIMYVLTTGCRWMDLPAKEYGPKSTVHDRLKDWEKLGVWKKIMDSIVSSGYLQGKLALDKIAVDSTDVAAKKGEKR
jgi:transposase